MDKKKIELIMLGFIIILALISVIFATLKEEEIEVVPTIPVEPEPVDDLGLSDEATLQNALESMNPALCVQIEDNVMRDRCERFTVPPPELTEEELADQETLNTALESNDASSCADIVDPITKDRCERFTNPQETIQTEETTEEISLEEPEPEVNEQLVADQTLFDEAVATSNAALCEQIVDAVIKDRCIRFTS